MVRVAVSRRLSPWLFPLPPALGLVALGIAAQRVHHPHVVKDWPQFGWNVASSGVFPGPTGITAANLSSLVRKQVSLDGTVDASAIYLSAVTVNGSAHDVFFMTTTYGKTIAVDASSGGILWEYTPSGFAGWAGTAQITTSTPAADPNRAYIYAAAPNGTVQKLAVTDGHVVWINSITLLPTREKIASPLRHSGGM